jgi:hypothetical protein
VDAGLRQAFERAMYALKDSGDGTWRGANAAQRLTLEFNGQEARPEGTSLNFRLARYGYVAWLQKTGVALAPQQPAQGEGGVSPSFLSLQVKQNPRKSDKI